MSLEAEATGHGKRTVAGWRLSGFTQFLTNSAGNIAGCGLNLFDIASRQLSDVNVNIEGGREV